MDCACLVHKIGYVGTITKEFTCSYSDRQLDYRFEGGKTVPHDNVYSRKINLQKVLEIT